MVLSPVFRPAPPFPNVWQIAARLRGGARNLLGRIGRGVAGAAAGVARRAGAFARRLGR